MPGGEKLVAFTRILHRTQPDILMSSDEVIVSMGTFSLCCRQKPLVLLAKARPIPGNCGCHIKNNAQVQGKGGQMSKSYLFIMKLERDDNLATTQN